MTRFKVLLGLIVILASVLGIGLLTFWDSEVGYSDGSIPTVTTGSSSNVTSTTARVNGYLDSDGGEATTVWFNYWEWYDANWSDCIEFSINASYVDSDLTNFPVLITGAQVNQSNPNFWTTVDVNGSDILFTDENGVKLNRELVSIDTTNMSMECYVNVSLIDDAIDTPIYMYYGNAGASESNDTETWNSDYVAVYHMGDLNTSAISDSTVNANTGTKTGANEPLEIDGVFAGDKAQKFDGTNDHIDIASTALQHLDVIFWNDHTANQGNIIDGTGGTNRFILFRKTTGTFGIYVDNTNKNIVAENIDRWNQISGRYDGTNWYMYHGDTSTDISLKLTIPVVSDWAVSRIGDKPTGSYPFNGSISELRISNVSTISAAWIESTYYSLMQPEDFCPASVYTLTYSTESGGSLTGDTSQEVHYGTNGTAVESVPDTCHYFINWTDSETDNPRTDLNISADLSVTANLGIYNFSVSYTAGANGNISGTLNQTVDCGGSGTVVTAVPSYCYHFVNWSDSSEMNPRYESNVSDNISVTANFAASGPYTLTYTAGANGSVVGTTPQNVACGSDGTEMEAVPEDGYWFSSWSDGSVTNPRTDTAVTGDVTVTAVFLNTVPPGTVVMDPPTTLQILDAKVFQDFVNSDDQLFVVSYIIEYEGVTPTQDIRNYWNLDIYDGEVLKARGKVRFWNYGPGSIYLAPTSALTWGSEYTIELTSVVSMVSTDPSTSYNLSGADWITNSETSGFDCEPLDDWVVETAESIDIYNSEPGTLTVYVPGYGTLLSNAGSQMFSIAIPNLMEVCPEIFSIVAEPIDPDSTPSDSLPTTGQTSLTNNFGATVITAFDNLGSHIGGLSGHILAGVFWFVIMLLVAGIGTGVSGSPVVGVIVALPILFIGNYLGVISLALMGVIGTLCILYLLRQLWLVGQ